MPSGTHGRHSLRVVGKDIKDVKDFLMLDNLSPFELINWGELFLWPIIGFVCFIKAVKEKNPKRIQLCILGLTFFVFGLTDYIELRTGAWWRPFGLLVLNALCLSSIVFFGVKVLRNR